MEPSTTPTAEQVIDAAPALLQRIADSLPHDVFIHTNSYVRWNSQEDARAALAAIERTPGCGARMAEGLREAFGTEIPVYRGGDVRDEPQSWTLDARVAQGFARFFNRSIVSGVVDAADVCFIGSPSHSELVVNGAHVRNVTSMEWVRSNTLASLHPTILGAVHAGRMSLPCATAIAGSGLSGEQQLALVETLRKHGRRHTPLRPESTAQSVRAGVRARFTKPGIRAYGEAFGITLNSSRGTRRKPTQTEAACCESGPALKNSQVPELIRLVMNGERVANEDAFDDEVLTQSLALEKAQLSLYVRRRLVRDYRLFGLRAIGEEGAGAIDIRRLADHANRAKDVYNHLSTMSGPVASALDDAARHQRNGGDLNGIWATLYPAVRSAVGRQM